MRQEVTFTQLVHSKKNLIQAHNDDVDLTKKYLDGLLVQKEVRLYEERPGPDYAVLDKSMPGDWGWDPLRLAETKTHLLVYRDAEVKHGRLAMLGAAGLPISELLHGSLSAGSGADSLLAEPAGRAPSVLNGGLGQVSGLFWFAALGVAATIEASTVSGQFEGWLSEGKPWRYEPGNLNFDPLSLTPKLVDAWKKSDLADGERYDDANELTANIQTNIEVAEITHGRVSMLAITGYAVQEALWRTPVVEQTPIFFLTPFYSSVAAALTFAHNSVASF